MPGVLIQGGTVQNSNSYHGKPVLVAGEQVIRAQLFGSQHVVVVVRQRSAHRFGTLWNVKTSRYYSRVASRSHKNGYPVGRTIQHLLSNERK